MTSDNAAKDRKVGGGTKAMLWATGFAAIALVGFVPGWWERRLYRQTETIVGVGAAIQPGKLVDARSKIDPGRTAAQISASLGQPSLMSSSAGAVPYDKWTYYYADGTMEVNLTGGVAQRISVQFGPPRIPTSRRPA